jgi:hypothetical protein
MSAPVQVNIDPRYPFHAKSHYDFLGSPRFISGFPEEEEDFATIIEARAWLTERGGGTIDKWTARRRYKRVELIPPTEDSEAAALIAG